ncbi:ATP-binding cassette sub-family G member 2, partial [Biomphalaria glabrata]
MAGREMTIFDVEKYNEKIAVTRKKASGAVLSAHNVSYTIKVASRFCSSEEKQILFDVTAIFKAGLTAVLGPTGSGKSSLLDILAGRKDNQRISGQLLLNGKPVPTNFKCMVGYVVQDDVVMGTLSVRENLTFSAALRLRASIKAAERKERINKVIKELGLEKCADTKVGNDFIRGVSGGERKRCNIGMELIISPQVLFLDEPTTGLDANTAKTVLLFLK